MQGRTVPVALPSGGQGQGVEVQVAESTERWSEFALTDGTVVRGKIIVTSAVRVEGEFDQNGNPLYMMNSAPMFSIVSVEEQFRKKA